MLNFKGSFSRMVYNMVLFITLCGRSAALILASTLLIGLLLDSPDMAAPAKKGTPSAPRMGALGQGIVVDLPDPKFPGKRVPLCHVRAATATGQSAENGFLGSMTDVSAILYQQGKSAATLTAPHARGDSLKESVIVTATGGVSVRSLLHPGTTLRADKLVWTPNSRTGQIVATGHVVFTDGKTGATIRGPRATADTAMKTLTMGSSDISALL